jgi:hypothetical protein
MLLFNILILAIRMGLRRPKRTPRPGPSPPRRAILPKLAWGSRRRPQASGTIAVRSDVEGRRMVVEYCDGGVRRRLFGFTQRHKEAGPSPNPHKSPTQGRRNAPSSPSTCDGGAAGGRRPAGPSAGWWRGISAVVCGADAGKSHAKTRRRKEDGAKGDAAPWRAAGHSIPIVPTNAASMIVRDESEMRLRRVACAKGARPRQPLCAFAPLRETFRPSIHRHAPQDICQPRANIAQNAISNIDGQMKRGVRLRGCYTPPPSCGWSPASRKPWGGNGNGRCGRAERRPADSLCLRRMAEPRVAHRPFPGDRPTAANASGVR